MHGPTPKTLKGAIVLDIAGLDALMAQRALFLDVGPADKKPADFPKDLPWLPIHRTIPGSVWLPGAGQLRSNRRGRMMFVRADRGTDAGDKSRPVVTFCHPDCWGSWNTAKRPRAQGLHARALVPRRHRGLADHARDSGGEAGLIVWDAASASGIQP